MKKKKKEKDNRRERKIARAFAQVGFQVDKSSIKTTSTSTTY